MVKSYIFNGILLSAAFQMILMYLRVLGDKVQQQEDNIKAVVLQNITGRDFKPDDNGTIAAGTILFPEIHLSTLKRDFNHTSNNTVNDKRQWNKTTLRPLTTTPGLSEEDVDEDIATPTKASPTPIGKYKNATQNNTLEIQTSGNGTMCSKAVNLLFLLDSSESVKFQHWSLILNFVTEISSKFTLAATKLGIIRYASEAEVALQLTQFYDENARNSAIDDIFYKTGGTRTDVALEKAFELLHTVENRKASQVLILVTDGPTNSLEINKNKFVEGKDLVQGPADSLKSEGVAIFCVGIEPDSVTPDEMQTMKEEMKIIASEPTSSHVFIADGYRELQRKVESVSKAACVVNGAWSQWSEFSPCTVTCGYGTKVRIRTCTNPKPENNGADCTGSRVENKPCDMGACIAFAVSSFKENVANDSTTATQMYSNQGSNQNIQVIQNVIEEIQKSDDRLPGCTNGYDELHLRDNQYIASSTYSRDIDDDAIIKMHAPNNGRLNNVDNAGSWCAEHHFSLQDDKNQFLQFSLDNPELISMIATQGSHGSDNWMKSYTVQYSNDEKAWFFYKNKGKLEANTDRDTVKRQILNPPIRAKYLRLVPQDWNKEGSPDSHDICFRAALYKCSDRVIKRDSSRDQNARQITKRSELATAKDHYRIHQKESRTPTGNLPVSKRILGRLRKMAKHIIKKMKNNRNPSP